MTMPFGYDWPRLHAVVNHFPAALLPVSVLFDLLGIWLKRESLKAAAFWALVAGVIGTIAAIGAGLLAEDVVQHSEQAHAIMETHETLAFIVLAIFGVLAIWRIVRRGVWSEKEQPIALTAGVIGIAILAYGAHLGGRLMFDHAVGVTTERLEQIPAERMGHEHNEARTIQMAPAAPATDSTHPQPGTPDTAKH